MEMQGYLGVRDSVRRGSSLKRTQRRWPSSESRATWLGDARLANATNLWELQTAHTLTERGEMAHKVALINMKGGVGKSTLAVNVAWEMATDPWHKSVLVVDLDPQFNCSQYLVGAHRIETIISSGQPTVWDILEQLTGFRLLVADAHFGTLPSILSSFPASGSTRRPPGAVWRTRTLS